VTPSILFLETHCSLRNSKLPSSQSKQQYRREIAYAARSSLRDMLTYLQAVASGVRLAFKHFGSLLGVAIGSAMINNSISGPGITASLKAQVIDDPTSVRDLDPVAFEAVLNAYEKGFQ